MGSIDLAGLLGRGLDRLRGRPPPPGGEPRHTRTLAGTEAASCFHSARCGAESERRNRRGTLSEGRILRALQWNHEYIRSTQTARVRIPGRIGD